MNSGQFNLVYFRHRGGDAVNQQLFYRLNQSGQCYLTHTRLHGKLTLRMSIGQTHTEERHVANAWQAIHPLARTLATTI